MARRRRRSMGKHTSCSVMLSGLVVVTAGAGMGCVAGDDTPSVESSLSALMEDGDAASVAPGAMTPPGSIPPPPRFCPSGDCTRSPLAFWKLDDCNPIQTQLGDSAFTSGISHPAFRAVSVACVPGVSGQAIRIAGDDDIMYAPDQPDFQFDAGLTIAAWINPDRVTGTQSVVRKRLDGG